MDKLEHFLKKNHHRIIYYYTSRDDILWFVMVLSILEGVVFLLDVRDGDIPYMDTGQLQKRFFIEKKETQDFPSILREQPAEHLIRDKKLLTEALKILMNNPIDCNLLIMGPGYCIDTQKNNTISFSILHLEDFPDTLDQHGIFQKYDLEYFYHHKNTISQNVKLIYMKMHENFLNNLEHMQRDWESFSRDPSRQLDGIKGLLVQYNERMKQCEELKSLIMNMYQMWKQMSAEHDLLEVQADPVSFDQSLQQNHKKQLLYRKLDRIKLIEKHATDLLIKIHIACMCLMFYMHILSCEMGTIHFKIDKTVELQQKIQRFILQTPSALSLI